MGLGCGAKVLKYCLFGFNLVFFIAGVVCLGLGIYLIADDHALDKMISAAEHQGLTSSSRTAAVYHLGVMMAVGGSIILIISFLGCCGAVKEWRPLLVLYAVCLMIILAVEIAAAIYAAINRNNLEQGVKNIMTETIKFYGGTHSQKSEVRTVWDKMMRSHKCCGVNSTENEFIDSQWFKTNFSARYPETNQDYRDYYPAACCLKADWITQPDAGTKDDPVCKNRFSEGCYLKLKENIESKLAIVIGVGIAVGLIQLVGIMFSLCLCRAITEESIGG